MPRMSKRIAAGILWFLAAWYLGAWIALLLGISDVLGPILGLAAAAVVVGDPLGLIWTRRAELVELSAQVTDGAADIYAEAA
jgi:hypothetical protein